MHDESNKPIRSSPFIRIDEYAETHESCSENGLYIVYFLSTFRCLQILERPAKTVQVLQRPVQSELKQAKPSPKPKRPQRLRRSEDEDQRRSSHRGRVLE